MSDSYYDPSGAAALLALFAGLGFVFFLFFVAYYVVTSIFYAKLFEKAGVEGKWRGWVPVYRELVFVKLGDLNPWWLLILIGATLFLSLIPYLGAAISWLPSLAGWVYLALAAYRVQTKLGKEPVWIVLAILVQPVWLGILAFGSSRWTTAVAPSPWGSSFLADTTVWPGIPVQTPAGGYAAPTGAAHGAPGAYPPPPAPGAPPQGYTAPPAAGGPVPPPAAPAQPPVPPTEPPAEPEQPRS